MHDFFTSYDKIVILFFVTILTSKLKILVEIHMFHTYLC